MEFEFAFYSYFYSTVPLWGTYKPKRIKKGSTSYSHISGLKYPEPASAGAVLGYRHHRSEAWSNQYPNYIFKNEKILWNLSSYFIHIFIVASPYGGRRDAKVSRERERT